MYWVNGASRCLPFSPLVFPSVLPLALAPTSWPGFSPVYCARLRLCVFGSACAFVFGLPLRWSKEDPGGEPRGGSSGFHVLRSRARFTHWHL